MFFRVNSPDLFRFIPYSEHGRRDAVELTLVLTALFIYFISLPKVTYGLSFKVIYDLRP